MLSAVSPGALPSRTAHVLETIKAAILDGTLAAGSALVESDLAAEFGVSKTPVREALKSLESTGLVVIRPYTGTTVRVLTYEDAMAIYDMRLLLEPEAVRRSVLAVADLSAAREALDRAALAAEASGRSTANRDFHRGLYAGCGNPLLVRTLDGLRDQTALISASSWARIASWEREAAEHAAILETAAAGDAEGAALSVRRHIEGFVDRQLRKEPPGR
jgi:DNA-binding GntR family transcriptional regulator